MSAFIKSTEGQNIIIKSTEDTPRVEILLNENKCIIRGNFHCVDPGIFFKPLMRWARDFSGHSRTPAFVVDFYFTHINSTSVSYLLKFIKRLLSSSFSNKSTIVFNWHIEHFDPEMEDVVFIFNEILENKINLVYLNRTGSGVVVNDVFPRSISTRIAERIFRRTFSEKYDGEVIVFNPLFLFSRAKS
jgi:hypothetical protein